MSSTVLNVMPHRGIKAYSTTTKVVSLTYQYYTGFPFPLLLLLRLLPLHPLPSLFDRDHDLRHIRQVLTCNAVNFDSVGQVTRTVYDLRNLTTLQPSAGQRYVAVHLFIAVVAEAETTHWNTYDYLNLVAANMVLPVSSGSADVDTPVENLARFGWLKIDDSPAHGPSDVDIIKRRANTFLPFQAVYTDGEGTL